ncbi:MAG TPA: DUF547 domain-containing protein [Thermoanaerobaculia bacterium]|nr:DUF547 domain-containing protein [Thermoanaerobaculia bacterium]
MTRKTLSAFLLVLVTAAATTAAGAAPPDYSTWQSLLSKYYDPAKGMNYKALKANDGKTLDALRRQMAQVDVGSLSKPDQLAYWINLYNISVVDTVVDGYPVESIRDLSTDPIVRLNVFKKATIDTRQGKVSLDTIENEKIRTGFKDPRIHFAINCAAESCPPIRPEPYAGARIDQQLDDQARKFLNGPHGVRLEQDGDELVVHTTKVMDWFADDFKNWGGGHKAFLRKYVTPDKQKRIDAAKDVKIRYDDYSWKLNDTSK